MENLFLNDENAVVDSNRILYTASPFARSSMLHLQEIGSLSAKQSHESSRSSLCSVLFFFVTDGKGYLDYKGIRYELECGSCVFIDCRTPYTHSTREKLWSLKWVHFYGPMLIPIYEKYRERGGLPVFAPKDLNPFYTIHQKLFEMAKSKDYIRDMRINQYLSELTVYLMEESWHPENKMTALKRASILEIRDYLDREYASKITLDDLCHKFFISKHYLTHSFKEQFGVSINSYLALVRVTHAKQLLRFTDKSVEEIGYVVGIGQPHYFSRVFKDIEGIPPSVYREQW